MIRRERSSSTGCRTGGRLGYGHLALVAAASALLACALPGRSYEVSPRISGTLHSPDGPAAGARIALAIRYPENPVLGAQAEVKVATDGRFEFAPETLAVAGKEYGKRYRLFLDLVGSNTTEILWRAQYPRTELEGPPVRLDCDLSRPPRHGQICWVTNGTRQPWLVDAGRHDFERLCVSCHGGDGRGGASTGTSAGKPPPDLTAIADRRGGSFPRAEITEWIDGRLAPSAHGTRSMPIWGERLEREYQRFDSPDELVGARIDTLVTYLESLQVVD